MKNRISERKQKVLLALDAPVESFSSDMQGEEKTESADTLGLFLLFEAIYMESHKVQMRNSNASRKLRNSMMRL